MHDNRDYADLHRTDIAVYNFRGYTVLKFDKTTKQLEIGKHANMCCFIAQDFKLMAKFLEDCYMFTNGLTTELPHVEVD